MNEPSPLYQQVKDYILSRIASGEWPTNKRILSEAELVSACGASRMTVNRALRELTAEGHLLRLQGVGTFVASPKPQAALLEIRSVASEIRERGGKHTSKILLHARETAKGELANAMQMGTHSTVFHCLILHLEDDRPVQLEDRYVNPKVAPDFLDQDFTRITPSEYLLDTAPVTEAEHIIEAVGPDRRIRNLLEMKPDEPCLVLHRRTWTNNLVATRGRFFYPGSRYRLGGRFKPSSNSRFTVA
ncbi:MAG: histidine utilization repressor [Desulfobacteraceae bacterium]|nr:MAG: histidine utilization repressor [Desulfobacteraceae bacterium]